jgi:hypothetical protein
MWHASNAGARGRGALSGMSSSNSSSAAEIVFDHVTKRTPTRRSRRSTTCR